MISDETMEGVEKGFFWKMFLLALSYQNGQHGATMAQK